MENHLFKLFTKKQKVNDLRPLNELMSEMGFVEQEFFVGINEHINKAVRVFNHKLLPTNYSSRHAFTSPSKTVKGGKPLIENNYSFNDSFLRNDLVPDGYNVREEWKFKRLDNLTSWLTKDNRKYTEKPYVYGALSTLNTHKIISDMHSEVMRLTNNDITHSTKLTALLIAANFHAIPSMVQISKIATEGETMRFVEALSKAEEMRLPIQDYQLLFETM